MLNETKLREVMARVLGVDAAVIGPDSSMDNVPSWDSLHQMNLVLALEEEFGVSISDEDAANITSYKLIKLVLDEQLGSR